MPDETFNPVLLGIISSLLATSIFIALSKLFNNIVLPWYGDKIYRGVRIDGKWDLDEWEDDIDKTFEFNLNQKGDSVKGFHYHKIKKENGAIISESYTVNGCIRDGYFFAILTPITSDIVDSGTVHFKIYKKEEKLCMKGNVTAVSSSNGGVTSRNDIIFSKSEHKSA